MARIGYAVTAVILVSGLFSFWQEYRIEQTLAALQKLLPQQVNAFRDDVIVQLPADQIVIGEIILLEAGNNVPADCRLIEGFGVCVNNATVTGESVSKALSAAPSAEDELVHSRNILLAGTSVVSGHGARWSSPPDRSPNSGGSLTFPRPVMQQFRLCANNSPILAD
jgi:P-type E1-E2 ATPase